jgi:hypothetical protein
LTASAPIPTPESRTGHAARVAFCSLIAASLLLVFFPGSTKARVLDQKALETISQIKVSIENMKSLMMDMAQSLRRPDISSGDSECLGSALGELQQGSQELAGYEYLLRIETEMIDFDDKAMKGILRFAIEKSISVLETERNHLSRVVDQCSRFPLSVGKTQQAMQYIDTIATILKSVWPRLS